MLMYFVWSYLGLTLFTMLSVICKWTFTGSKSDYAYLQELIERDSDRDPKWEAIFFWFVVLISGVFWWATFYFRIRDVISERAL